MVPQREEDDQLQDGNEYLRSAYKKSTYMVSKSLHYTTGSSTCSTLHTSPQSSILQAKYAQQL